MKLKWILLIGFLLLLGCDEVVTRRYATRSAAKEDALFEKGWLPEIIPSSSRQIIVSNDLDTNTSKGEFYFDRSELPSFLAMLSEHQKNITSLDDATERYRNSGYIPYTYDAAGSRWIFFINSDREHAHYLMNPR